MATLITFNVGGDDTWLRQQVRGAKAGESVTLKTQRVIVEDRDFDRMKADMASLKHRRNLVYGGCLSFRVSRDASGVWRDYHGREALR